jgi:hypothetical protein
LCSFAEIGFLITYWKLWWTGITGGGTIIHRIAELCPVAEQLIVRTVVIIGSIPTTCILVAGIIGTSYPIIAVNRRTGIARPHTVTGLLTVAE